MNIMQAIATEEGFFVNHSRSGRNNNPGDINFGDFARKHGATRVEIIPPGYNEKARFAYFPDQASGFAAMKDLLKTNYKGLTVKQALYKWAPPTDGNDSEAYVANVCKLVGCKPTDIIDTLLGD